MPRMSLSAMGIVLLCMVSFCRAASLRVGGGLLPLDNLPSSASLRSVSRFSLGIEASLRSVSHFSLGRVASLRSVSRFSLGVAPSLRSVSRFSLGVAPSLMPVSRSSLGRASSLRSVSHLSLGRASSLRSVSHLSLDSIPSASLGSIPSAQSSDSSDVVCYQIKELRIYNNKRTKLRLFSQEMRLQLDSTYCSSDWDKWLAKERAWIYGTGLFDTVDVILRPLDTPPEAAIEVSVKERWYIYPRPIISFGQYSAGYWWSELNRSFKYISYGIGLSHQNLRGLNDRLSMNIRLGNEPALLFRYTGPDRKYPSGRLFGYGLLASYASTRSLIFNNVEHMPIALTNDSDFLHTRLSASFLLRYRPRINLRHAIRLTFEYRSISDSLHNQNATFVEPLSLGQGKVRRGLGLVYSLVVDRRDQQHYPLRGSYLGIELQRYGLGAFRDMNLSRFRLNYRKYITLSKNWYLSNLLRSSFSLPLRQAFVDYESLNLSFQVRGYQGAFVQGPLFFHFNTLLKRWVFEHSFRFKRLERRFWRYISYVPITAYGYVYANASWVASYPKFGKQAFTDELLIGIGPGAEILTFYDLIFGSYYAFTRHGSTLGIYVKLRGGN